MSRTIKTIKDIQPSFLKIKKGCGKITNNRQFLIKQFVDKINQERKGTKYKQLTPRGVAVMVGHLNEFDLAYFYKKCDNADSFGKMFFGCLKNK